MIAEDLYSLGRLSSTDAEQLSAQQASELHPWAPLLWGSNCRSRADRLRKLGWSPKHDNLEAYLMEMVKFEVDGTGATNVKASFDKA